LLVSLVLTLISAVAYGLSFPPTSFRALAWVAIAPFLVALRRVAAPPALLLGFVWGIAAAYATGDWMPRAVVRYYDQPYAVGLGFFFVVSAVTAGWQYAAFAGLYRARDRRRTAVEPVVTACLWVVAELARVKPVTGNPWALAGYSQVGVLRLMQIADLTGAYGLGFAVVVVNAAIAELFGALRAGRGSLRQAWIACATAAAFVLGVIGYGELRLRALAAQGAGAEATTVAIVQGNLDLGSQWKPELYGENLGAYLDLTFDALRSSHARLVVWPENTMTFFIEGEPTYRRAIAAVLSPAGAELLAGGPRTVRKGEATYYNSAFLLGPQGAIVGVYDKQDLVPFAEYFPLPGLDYLRRRFARVREFTPGEPTPLLPTVAGRAGVMICNEAMFGEIAAERVRAGAELLVNLTNDSWVGEAKFAAIALDIVTLRAVEQRRYLLRASTSGPSAIVDPLGRVLARTDDTSRRATLAGVVRRESGLTPYARFGDVFAYLCALVSLAAFAPFAFRRGSSPSRTNRFLRPARRPPNR
jgi:apolipoprotein N-acyltransferase